MTPADALPPDPKPHPALIIREAPSRVKTRRSGFPWKKRLSFLFSPVFGKFRKTLLLIFILILLAALVLKHAMRLSWTDALYFVVTTVTTVGYGDFSFAGATAELKLFGCLLMLGGAALLTVLFSAMTDILLSEKMKNVWGGGRPVPAGGHVIVAGAGHLGLRVVSRLLERGIPVAVIENKGIGKYPEDVKRHIAVVEGLPGNPETLSRAGAKTARSILCLTENDVENLGIALAAGKLNPHLLRYARIFDDRLGERLEGQLNLTRVLSVSSIAAPYFVAAVFAPQILLALRWNNELLFIAPIPAEDPPSAKQGMLTPGPESTLRVFSIPLEETAPAAMA